MDVQAIQVRQFINPRRDRRFFNIQGISSIINMSKSRLRCFSLLTTSLRISRLIHPSLARPSRAIATRRRGFFVLNIIPVLSLNCTQLKSIRQGLTSIQHTSSLDRTPPIIHLRLCQVSRLLFQGVERVNQVRLLHREVTRVKGYRIAQRLLREVGRIGGPTRHCNVGRQGNAVIPFTIFTPQRNNSRLIRRIVCVSRIRRRLQVVRLSERIIHSVIARDHRYAIVIQTTPFPRRVQGAVSRSSHAHLFNVLRRGILSHPLQLTVQVVRYDLHEQ